MQRVSITLLFLFITAFGFAQKKQYTREEYIQQYYKLAISEMIRSGIPASITLAQGCWESGNGNSRLATEANNHFGIKCKADWKGKKIYHDDDARQECFRKYPNAEASYIDHSNFLMAGSRYSFLFQLDSKDYVGWAHGLKKAGYATDPTYAQRLIKIIEDFKLSAYDQYNDSRQMPAIGQEQSPQKLIVPPSTLAKTNARHKIEMRNGLRTIVVAEGDTYESLTRELKMKDWELYTYNDFEKGRNPKPNEILYLQHKHKKAGKKQLIHIAEEGDTMHYLAQRYGLKLKPLLKRNRMDRGKEPVAGQKVYLRKKSPRKG